MSIMSIIIHHITHVIVSVSTIHVLQVEVVCWKKNVLNLTVNPQVSAHIDSTNVTNSNDFT